MIKYKNKLFEKYIDNKDISLKIKSIAEKLNEDFENKKILFVGILSGSIRFMMNLLENIKFSYEYDFLKVSSYKDMNRGELSLELNVNKKYVNNKDVIIIEDIIDSGKTLDFITKHLKLMNPNSLNVVSLLIKNDMKSKCNYYGFEIDNKFVIGYGLDINNLFRDLNHIYIKKDEER